MKTPLFLGLLEASNHILESPGSLTTVVDHPVNSQESVGIAIVFQHRFVFPHWLKWRNDSVRKYRMKREDKCQTNLLTIDWHDDVGTPSDYNDLKDVLCSLDDGNVNETALFSWVGLRSLNDGHIEPAAFLNAIGDVYVILKQGTQERTEGSSERERHVIDRYGNRHDIFYYDNVKQFLKAQQTAPLDDVYFDIDLDYFVQATDESDEDELANTLVSDRTIRRFISPSSPLMRWVLPRIKGFTIALEARYCGGLGNCLHALRLVTHALFNPPLLAENATWRMPKTSN